MAEKKKELHSFMISFDSETLVKYLAPDQKAQLLDALYDYAIRGNKRDFSGNPLLMASYEMMTKTIDENKQKYDDKCLKNSANQKLRHLYDDFQKSKDRGLPTIQIEQAIRNICDEYEITIRPDIFKQMGVSTNVDERIQKDTISTNANTDRNRNTDIKGNRNTDRESDRESDTESYPDINQQTDRQTESKEIPAVDNSSASVDSDGRTAWEEITSFLLESDLEIARHKIVTNKEDLISKAISGINILLRAGNSIDQIKEGLSKYYSHHKKSGDYKEFGWGHSISVHRLLSDEVGVLKQYLVKEKTTEGNTWLESVENSEIYKVLDDINWYVRLQTDCKYSLAKSDPRFKSAYTGIEKLLSRFSKKTVEKAITDFYENSNNPVTLDVLVNDMDLLEPCLNSVPDPVNAEELPFN